MIIAIRRSNPGLKPGAQNTKSLSGTDRSTIGRDAWQCVRALRIASVRGARGVVVRHRPRLKPRADRESLSEAIAAPASRRRTGVVASHGNATSAANTTGRWGPDRPGQNVQGSATDVPTGQEGHAPTSPVGFSRLPSVSPVLQCRAGLTSIGHSAPSLGDNNTELRSYGVELSR